MSNTNASKVNNSGVSALLPQLNERGLTIDANGTVVEIEKPNRVLSVVKEGISDGKSVASTVVSTTGKTASKVVTETVTLAVDLPIEGVKATGRGVAKVGRKLASGHNNRLQARAERKALKAQARAEAEAAEAAEAKASA